MGSPGQLLPMAIATIAMCCGLASLFVPWFRQEVGELGDLTISVEYRYNELCVVVTTEVDDVRVYTSECRSYTHLHLGRSEDNANFPEVSEALSGINTTAHIVVLALGLVLSGLGLVVGLWSSDDPFGPGSRGSSGCLLIGGALMAAALPAAYYDLVEPLSAPDDGTDSGGDDIVGDIGLENSVGLILLITGSILTWLSAICACLIPQYSGGGGGKTMQMTTIRGV